MQEHSFAKGFEMLNCLAPCRSGEYIFSHLSQGESGQKGHEELA